MAVRWLISGGGNFSSTSVWNDGTLLGIPTTGDDVFTNGFTVNMDTNATVNSLNNSARARDIATPQMTANNAPSPYVAAASTQGGTGFEAWRAFDRNYSNSTNYWAASALTGWLSMDLGVATVIDGYTIYGRNDTTRNPRNWTFEGSSDNTNWTVLQTVTNAAGISTYSISSIGNTTAYRYYRINVSANGGLANLSINEVELYQRFTAALTAGGSFNFNTAGVTVSATSVSQAATNLFTVTNTTGTVTLSVASNINAVSGQTTMTYSGAGNFVFTCPNLVVSGIGGASRIISKSSAGLITINGNALLGTGTNSGAANVVLDSTNGNTIINGNVSGFPSSGVGAATVLNTIRQTAGTLTINGNVTPSVLQTVGYSCINFSGTTLNLNGNTQGGDGYGIVSTGTVNITGTLVGGNSVFANNATITINVTGDVYAGLAPAINCNSNAASQASTVNLTGNMYNTLGRSAIWCPNVFISNTATTLWRMDTGGGNYKFLYSADSTPNLPPQTDVRFGTTFGPALSLTGTMVVPSASDVRESVPVDNTVGTGELTSADIISGINASSDDLAVRLKNTLTDTTAGNIISQYNNS
jgi:hypothetical protein